MQFSERTFFASPSAIGKSNCDGRTDQRERRTQRRN
jgi:hypothetical protein